MVCMMVPNVSRSFFSHPATATKMDVKNKAGLTGDEVIQKGIGYLKANKDREAKLAPKK